MSEDLHLWLTLLRDGFPDSLTPEEWIDDACALAEDLMEPSDLVDQIIECLYLQMTKRQKRMVALTATPLAAEPLVSEPLVSEPLAAEPLVSEPLTELAPPSSQEPLAPTPSQEHLDALLAREQTAQRTAAWYEQAQRVVTASEVSHLFGAPRGRGQLVASKAQPYRPRNQFLATTSDFMAAFDWGIRFEPCIKAIYEDMHGAIIRDLGRLVHPTDPRVSASPDGLVYTGERKGRLVEFKAPVTREIQTGVIPKDYYAQMQLQLNVCNLQVCDFVEASFGAPYQARPVPEGPGLYHGIIAVMQREAVVDGQPMYYVYSPLNPPDDWVPQETDEVAELVSWRLMAWQEQVVTRSDAWWQALLPALDSFWADVEKYKRGEFVVPESTRPKRPAEACSIVFHRLDENGEPIA